MAAMNDQCGDVEVTMLKFKVPAEVVIESVEQEAEFVRRVQETSERRVPSLFAADRERILQDRAAFGVVMQQLAAKRLDIGERVADRVKRERLAAGVTQTELARRTGIHRPNIARLEGGRFTPTLETLMRVASALNVSLATIVAEPTDSDTVTA